MPEEERNTNWRHQITLVDREDLSVDGVVSLGSYDENEVVMETEAGFLLIKGEGLNIKQLNLDKGNIVIDGMVKVISYDDTVRNKKGLLERLLK